MLSNIMRAVVVAVLIALPVYHYQNNQPLLYIGDILISFVILGNWVRPFIVMRLRGGVKKK